MNHLHHTPRPQPRSRASHVSIAVLVILVLAILLGFVFDALCTLVEKQLYPRKYDAYVITYAHMYGVPTHLIYAVIKAESNFDTGALSSAGAVGLMQMMPDTFRWLTDDILFEHLEDGMLYDPETNIRYGTYMLSRMYARYGDWDAALAAYNAGAGRVDQWLESGEVSVKNGTLTGIPFRETRQYVAKIRKARKTYDRLYDELLPEAPESDPA